MKIKKKKFKEIASRWDTNFILQNKCIDKYVNVNELYNICNFYK